MQKPIAIIGGGPGGLSAAIRAAELELTVVLFDKGKIGTGIKCAEGFIDTLGRLGKPESGVLFKVKKAIFDTGKAHHIHLQENDGLWMIDRGTWQKSLARRAKELAVSIEEDVPIGKNQLREMCGAFSYIIDASGAPSVTSRLSGFVTDYLENATLLAQYVVNGDFHFLGKNTIRVNYEPPNTGYHYIYPKGDNIANVGVGRYYYDEKEKKTHLKQELDRVLRKAGLDGYAIHKKVSGFTPSCSVNKLIWGNILLVGDAAALCSPLHGGGIDMACISGRLAAELIASNRVFQYPERLWDMVGKKLIMEMRVRKLWHLWGYSFLRFALRRSGLFKGIIFNRRPYPQIIGYGGQRIF